MAESLSASQLNTYQSLTNMGFDHQSAVNAAQTFGDNVQGAVDHSFIH